MKSIVRLTFLLIVALVLVACGQKETATGVTVSSLSVTSTPTAPHARHTLTPISVNVPTSTPTSVPTAAVVDTPISTDTPEPPTATPAIPSSTPTQQVVTGFVLRDATIRNGPGESYSAVANIAQGQEVTVVATDPSGDWLLLNLPGPDQSWINRLDISLLDAQMVMIPVDTKLPTPPPTPTPGEAVQLYESVITLPTYPWRDFLTPTVDPVSGWDYHRFDAHAYHGQKRTPTPHGYRLINLENRWVKANVMPELGGRVYQLIFKPTGSNALYQNPVIKPSPWGPGPQGNGWLAVGGIEWGLPVPEHGYATSEPWGYITLPGAESQAVTLFDKHQDTVHLSVDVSLQPDTAALQLDFTLSNESDHRIPTSFWVNAMVAPGPANTVGSELRFLFPGNKAIMHSTGDEDLPLPNEIFDWPFFRGRDLSRLGNWNHWLGFFMFPQAQENWAAIYDPSVDEGLVRVFPREKVPGLKAFGFGWQNPISPKDYTDDGSAYIEMHGGVTPTFDQNLPMQAGERLHWRELWYPVAGIGGVSRADAFGAVHLSNENDGMHLRLFAVRPVQGKIVVVDAAGQSYAFSVRLAPDHPGDIKLPAVQLPLLFQMQTSDGRVWQMSGLW